MTTEFKVGIVVMLAILILFYMSFRIGKFGALTRSGYTVTAEFDNIAGLDTKSPVELAGVEIGRVSKIDLVEYRAKASLLIRKEVQIPIDSRVSIKSFGILGDKYLEITPGQSKVFAKNGDQLTNVVTYADYDEIFQNVATAAKTFGETMEQFKGAIGDEEKQNLRESLANIKEVSGDFKVLIAENRGNVKKIVTNFADASSKLGPLADKADSTFTRINTIVQDVGEGKGTLGKLAQDDQLYNDARDAVASLKSISSDVEQGKGTLGMLVKDENLYVEVKETVKNIKDFTGGVKDGNLVGEAQQTMKKIQRAAEGIQEQTPITILGTIFGVFF
jgi:phospholipid/cholesterol/gamma-HCH transport system substrate-binding protein